MSAEEEVVDVGDARDRFRDALRNAHQKRSDVGGMEAAAARYCQVLRRAGQTPERALVSAKAVIEEAIDGRDVALAERAVSRCIEYYFRD